MPGSLPGDTALNNAGNPNAGMFVIMDPLSGPKGAPLAGASGNLSTGGLSTGIGYGCNHVIGPTAPDSIKAAGFDDNQVPGTVQAQGFAGQAQNTVDSRMMYIGGGRMIENPDTVARVSVPWVPSRYTAGIALVGAGNGGSRDSGANTGFAMKTVTATGAVANGAAIETAFNNRSGVAMVSGQSAFGSGTSAQSAPAAMAAEGEEGAEVDPQRGPPLTSDNPTAVDMDLVADDDEPIQSWSELQHGMSEDEMADAVVGGMPAEEQQPAEAQSETAQET